MIMRGLIVSAIVAAAMAGLSAWAWSVTPADAQIPVHFSVSGEVNRYGSRLEAFGLIPALTIGLSLLLAAAPKIDPRGRNLASSGPLLMTVWMGLLAILTVTHLALTLPALGVVEAESSLMLRLVLAAVALFLAVVGNMLGKARPNWFVGVRTPWSLSSDHSWDVTHRWAGRGFVLSGIVGSGVILLAPVQIGIAVFVALICTTSVGSILISYLAWRTDPERETFSEAD